MARRQQSLLEDFLVSSFHNFKATPFWVGPVIAIAVFVGFRFVLPLLVPAPQANSIDGGIVFRPLFWTLAWIVGGGVLLVWAMAEMWKLWNDRR